MARLTKKQKEAHAKVEPGKVYNIADASALVKEITNVNFDASVDLAVRLNVDPRKANQMVRGVVTLPHGTGKDVKVLALVTPDKEAEAKAAGADYVGLDEYLTKIKGGWTDVDVIVTMPSVMGKLGPLGRVLGPRGLMPNPKTGTVTMDVAKAVSDVKAGKIDFKVEKTGRDALFMGLGDVIFPGMLVISTITFLPETGAVVGSLPLTPFFGWIHLDPLAVGLGTLLGGLIGYLGLMTQVAKGKPQAGLPLLNGGAILGYFITGLIVYGPSDLIQQISLF